MGISKKTAILLVIAWLIYALVLGVISNTIWYGLYQEEWTAHLLAMSLTALPMFLIGIPFIIKYKHSRKGLKRDETAIMFVISIFVSAVMITLGYIWDISQKDWFAIILLLLSVVFLVVLYVNMADFMQGEKELVPFLIKSFFLSFIPAVFVAVAMTSVIIAFAEHKLILILIMLLFNSAPATTTVFVRIY